MLNTTLEAQGLTIGSGATFSLGGATLIIPGNWNNYGTFNQENGQIIFNGQSGNQTITNPSGENFTNIAVNKASGDVVLENGLTINGTLSLVSGDLDLNGNIITMNLSGLLNESEGQTVKGDSGYITFTEDINAPSGNIFHGLGFEIATESNLGNTTIERGNASQSGNGNAGILRYYNITPANNSSLNATIIFHYDDSELNGLPESKLALFRSTDNGSSWQIKGGIIDSVNNNVSLSGVDALSMWTVADSGASLANYQPTATNTTQNKRFYNTGAAVDLDDIVVSDPDGASEQITAVLTLSDINTGELTAASGNGESYDPSTGVWTITNSLTNVNTALAAVGFLPDASLQQNDTISIYIADELGGGAVPVTGSISLIVLNQPTTTGIDNVSIDEDVAQTTVDLSLYFDDLKDGPSGLSYTVASSTNPQLFSYVNISGSTLTLTPASEQSGSSLMTIRATDTDSLYIESSFTIAVNSVNDAPVISWLSDVYKNEDDTARVLVTVSDPDGDLVTLSAKSSDENVSLTFDKDTLILIPAKNWYGSAFITVNADDGEIISQEVFSFIVKAVNDAPVFLETPTLHFDEDGSYTYDLCSCDSLTYDVDDDSLTYFLKYNMSCMNVKEQTGQCFVITPPCNWFGVDTMKIGVSDGIDTVYSDLIITVNPVNDIPVFEGMPEAITIMDDKTENIKLWDFISDIETPDSLLTFSFSVVPDSIGFNYIDTTGVLSLSAKGKFVGSAELTITGMDPDSGETMATIIVTVKRTTTVVYDFNGIPDVYTLYQNYPNPFNPVTVIRYGLPYESTVKLIVYNILGQEIAVLENNTQAAGYYKIEWNAGRMGSGIYIYRLSARSTDGKQSFIKVRKMLLVK